MSLNMDKMNSCINTFSMNASALISNCYVMHYQLRIQDSYEVWNSENQKRICMLYGIAVKNRDHVNKYLLSVWILEYK